MPAEWAAAVEAMMALIIGSDRLRELHGMVESAGLIAQAGPRLLPASHNAHLMQIEETLTALGAAISKVHAVRIAGARDAAIADIGDERQAGVLNSDALASGSLTTGVLTDRRISEYLQSQMQGAEHMMLSGPYSRLKVGDLVDTVTGGLAMVEKRPFTAVVTQGRPTLENLLLGPGGDGGFADWPQIGLGDRHLDLALACRDVLERCGPNALVVVLDGYGIESVDPVRLDWYSHVVELLVQIGLREKADIDR